MKLRYLSSLLASCFLLASAIFTPPTTAQTAPHRVEVTAKRFAFTPSEITLHKGEPVILVFTSGDVTHGISFDELNLKAIIDKKSPVEVSFTPQTVGDFVSHCANFCGSGHGSMMLTIHVVE